MRFQSFKKNTTKNSCFLALDIGTEAVKALVFEREKQQYSILGSALQYFDESGPFDNDKAILNVKEEAVNRAGKLPGGLLLSFAPNILRSRIRTFSMIRQKPEEIIAKKEAGLAIETALKEVEKEITSYFVKNSGIMPQDIQFIDNKIIEIKIDGYEVPDLLGYGGKSLEFKVLTSFLFSKAYFAVENFDNAQIVNPVKNLGVLGVADGFFIDIGGEVTQICLLRDGKIDFVDEFDAGGKDFSRALSQTLGIRLSEARLLKERYSKSDLAEETRTRIKDFLSSPIKEWHDALKSKIKAVNKLPSPAFFLFGGGSLLPEIGELITSDDKEVKFLSLKDFSAKGGSASGGKNIIDHTGCLNNPQFVSSILLFYDR